MTLHQVTHDAWFKIGLAATVFAAAMLFANLLLPADDLPQAWIESYEG